MAAQVWASFGVGIAVSAVLFLPLVVWQYRRFGRYDAWRMAWTVAGFIYAASLVAFTIFPLPSFTGDYCALHATAPLWDPLRFPREWNRLVGEGGVRHALRSAAVWEVGMNVVLFVPFGIIARRCYEWPRWGVALAGFTTSLLIEATQLTGNWGLAPCSYRYADTTDLITNTTGVLVGLGLERATPRLLSTKAHLLQRRDLARPVTRGRRLAGAILDAWYLLLSGAAGGVVGGVVTALRRGLDPDQLTGADVAALMPAIAAGAVVAGAALVMVPALGGTGASLGQRTVYLRPAAASLGRLRSLLRALLGQGVVVALLAVAAGVFASPLRACVALAAAGAWLALEFVWVVCDPRGLSYRLSGCRLVDSREHAAATAGATE